MLCSDPFSQNLNEGVNDGRCTKGAVQDVLEDDVQKFSGLDETFVLYNVWMLHGCQSVIVYKIDA